MTNFRQTVFVAAVVLLSMSLSAGEIVFVKDGVSHTRIQMHRRATHLENRAAEELRAVLVRMAGVDVFKYITPGVELLGTKAADTEILLVTEEHGGDLLPARALERLAATKNPEAFVICAREDRGSGAALCIAGKTPVAVYYGVYAFLEDYLGCGFYHVDKDGTVIPKAGTVAVPDDVFDFREPWVETRRVSCWFGNVKPFDLEDVFNWQAKRAFNWEFEKWALWGTKYFTGDELTQSQLAHLPFGGCSETITTMVTPDSMFKEHPEYFPLVDGKRTPGGYPARRCFTNPDVVRAWVGYGVSYNDYGGFVNLGMTDVPGGWCQCDRCRAYGTGRDGKWTSENYVHRFWGEVVKGILAERPNARIFLSEYLTWRKIPTCDFSHDDRVTGVYCPHGRCYVHALNDPDAPCNRTFDRLYTDWQKYYPRHGLFEYYCYGFTEYAPIEYVFVEDMKYYRRHGLGYFIEDTSNGSIVTPHIINNWQFYYILSRMCWNADLDVEKEMEKAYRRYYGVAAEPMLRYHAYRRQLWESAPGHCGMGLYGEPRHGLLLQPEGSVERLRSYLKEAATFAKGDADVLARIDRDRKCLEGIWVKRWEKENAKATFGRQQTVPFGAVGASRPIVVDGVVNEKGWTDIPFLSGFETAGRKAPKAMTAVRAAFDGSGLIFGIEALAERKVQPGDAVKVILVSPKGVSSEFVVRPVAVRADNLAVQVLDDRYVAELRVPFSLLGVPGVKTGDAWKVHVVRRAADGEISSLDGVSAADAAGFRRATFGRNLIENGTFERRTAKYVLGCFSDRPKLSTNALGRVSVKLEHSAMLGTSVEISPAEKPELPIRGAVTYSGGKRISVHLTYATLDPNDRAKQIPKAVKVGEYPPAPEPRTVTFEYDLPKDVVQASVRVYGDAEIHSVEVTHR